MTIDYKEVGKRLAKRRKALGLKQYQVCEAAGLNSKYLSCIETATAVPSLDAFLRILDVLNMTPNEALLGESSYKNDSEISTVSEAGSDSSSIYSNAAYAKLSTKGRALVDSYIEWIYAFESRK